MWPLIGLTEEGALLALEAREPELVDGINGLTGEPRAARADVAQLLAHGKQGAGGLVKGRHQPALCRRRRGRGAEVS